MMLLTEQVLPELEQSRPDQAQLLRSYLDHNDDIEAAAGLTERNFRLRLQDTILPSARRVARRLGFTDTLDA